MTAQRAESMLSLLLPPLFVVNGHYPCVSGFFSNALQFAKRLRRTRYAFSRTRTLSSSNSVLVVLSFAQTRAPMPLIPKLISQYGINQRVGIVGKCEWSSNEDNSEPSARIVPYEPIKHVMRRLSPMINLSLSLIESRDDGILFQKVRASLPYIALNIWNKINNKWNKKINNIYRKECRERERERRDMYTFRRAKRFVGLSPAGDS